MKDEAPVYNVLMYSHDTYGLGHIRRTMAIANHLRDANTNVLILTGSPIAGRFRFPEQVDFPERQRCKIRKHRRKATSRRETIAQTMQFCNSIHSIP